MKTEHIPRPQSEAAAALFNALIPAIPAHCLSLGGGTVLAARWRHRRSLNVKLYCASGYYGRLESGQLFESLGRGIKGCDSSRAECSSFEISTEINGIETGLRPGIRVPALAGNDPTVLVDTDLILQSAAQILYRKIEQMFMTGVISPRDAYDVASATIHDPRALSRMSEHVGSRTLQPISRIAEALPHGWSTNHMEPVVEPAYQWSEAEMQRRLIDVLMERS